MRLSCVILCAAVAQTVSLFGADLEVPLRQQWNANGGYCGEASLVGAGLYFGQYCSQFTARKIASPQREQSDRESQLLVGVNDAKAAKAMKLDAKPFNWTWQSSPRGFLGWIKEHVSQGHPVIIGLFNNTTLLDEESPGDEEYDHIVPVVGIDSKTPAKEDGKSFAPNDMISFSDNGLYTPAGRSVYIFRTPLTDFVKNRRAANSPDAPIYSLKDKPPNYGIAITGVADRDGVTVPVRLVASRNDEPDMPDRSNAPPPTEPLSLTATVSIPDQSVAYKLYRYDSFEKVPVRAFNANADKAAQVWNIPPRSGASFKVSHDTDTGATVVFRAVPASAP